MIAPSHLCFGATCGLILASFVGRTTPSPSYAEIAANIAALALGSLLPDIDSPGSIISRVLPFSQALHRRFPHRSLPHSLLGLSLATGGFYLLSIVVNSACAVFNFPAPQSLVAYFFTGFVSHLIADSFTIRGIKFLYPYPIAFAYPSLEQYRLRTGTPKHEIAFSAASLGLAILYLPVIFQGGATATLHQALANIRSAYEEYQSHIGIEVILAFVGYDTTTKQAIASQSLILEARPEQFTVFFQGNICTIGEHQGTIIASSARCLPTNIPISVTPITITHQPWDQVIEPLPPQTLITGELTADQPFTASPTLPASQNSITITGQTLRFTYAQRPELANLHIQPRTNVEKLAAELQTLQESLTRTGEKLQAAIAQRHAEKDAYTRDNLFSHIQTLRKEQSATEAKMERQKRDLRTAQSIKIYFSGTLFVRSVFVN